MLLDAPEPFFEVADNEAVADDGGVILDDRAAQPGDLLASFLLHGPRFFAR